MVVDAQYSDYTHQLFIVCTSTFEISYSKTTSELHADIEYNYFNINRLKLSGKDKFCNLYGWHIIDYIFSRLLKMRGLAVHNKRFLCCFLGVW